MNEFFLKVSDILPKLEVTVSGDGKAQDLSSFTGVDFRYRQRFTGTAVRRSGEILNAGSGIVRYTWQSADSATVGPYWGEFILMGAGGTVRSHPQGQGYINFEIVSGLI